MSMVQLLAILRLGLATCMMVLLLMVQALAIGHQLCLGRLPPLPSDSAMLPRRSRMQVLAVWRLLCLWRLPGASAMRLSHSGWLMHACRPHSAQARKLSGPPDPFRRRCSATLCIHA